MYFGFTMIPKVTTLFCTVETENLKVSLDSNIGKVYNMGYGSKTKINLASSCGMEYVCFIGQSPNFNNVFDKSVAELMKTRESISKDNVYVKTNKDTKSLEVKNIDVKEGILCLKPSGGLITFNVENKGDYVEISK